MSGIGAGQEGEMVGGEDVLAEQQERLRPLVQPEELRFEAPDPHSPFLHCLTFPDVIAHTLAHKGFHYSSLILHKRAIAGKKSVQL